MDAQERERIRRLFADAIALPAGERGVFLNFVCADDPGLRRHLESLTASHEQAREFLSEVTADVQSPGDGTSQPDGPPSGESPNHTAPRDRASADTIESNRSEQVGNKIGPYKLLQLVGEGGFGEVWMADQREPIKRRVALKVVKPGMDSRQVIARFEAERQALAMMDHPNVARVLDACVTDAGRRCV